MKSRKSAAVGVALIVVTAVLLLTPGVASAAQPRGSDRIGAYVYHDDRSAAGPNFNFRNAPNALAFADVDDGEVNVTLPFAFNFYGINRTTMTVSPNGAVVFPQGQQISFVNRNFNTDALANQEMIAPMWDDWVIFGQVSTGLSGNSPNRVFTVHWDDVRPFGGSNADSVDFQLQLFENGDRIEFHYLDVESSASHDRGVSATVGIDNDTTSRLQYSFNATSLVNNRAIRFSPVRCNNQIPTITGGFGADAINGTAGVDIIAALSGNDTVTTLGGNDIVCGGDGNDTIRLGAGNDRAVGENGHDTMYGAGGNDRLDGGANNDALRGGPGSDVCLGRTGFDTASGCEAVSGVP
jgi:Ca2+-binding RTX toxin-like protein